MSLIDLRMVLISFYPAFLGAHQGGFHKDRFFVLFLLFNIAFVVRHFFYGKRSLTIEGLSDDELGESRFVNFQGAQIKARGLVKAPSHKGQYLVLQRVMGGVLSLGAGALFIFKPELQYSQYDLLLLFSLATSYYAYSPMQLRAGLLMSGLYFFLYNYRVEMSPTQSIVVAIFITFFVFMRIQSWSRESIPTKLKAPAYDHYLNAIIYTVLFLLVFKGFQYFIPDLRDDESFFKNMGLTQIVEKNWQRVKPLVGGVSKLPGLNLEKIIDEKVQDKIDKIKNSGVPREVKDFEAKLQSFVKGGAVPQEVESQRDLLAKELRQGSQLSGNDVERLKNLFKERDFRNLLRSGNIKQEIQSNRDLFYKVTQTSPSNFDQIQNSGGLNHQERNIAEVTRATLKQMNFDKSYEDQFLRRQLRKELPKIKEKAVQTKAFGSESLVKPRQEVTSEIERFIDRTVEEKLPKEYKVAQSKESLESESFMEALSDFFAKTWAFLLLLVCLVLLLKFVSVRKIRGTLTQSKEKKPSKVTQVKELSQRYYEFQNKYKGSSNETEEAYRLCLELLEYIRLSKPSYLPPSLFVKSAGEKRPEIKGDLQKITDRYSDQVFGLEDLNSQQLIEFKQSMASIYKKFEERSRLAFK